MLKRYWDVLITSEYIEHECEYEYITHNFLDIEVRARVPVPQKWTQVHEHRVYLPHVWTLRTELLKANPTSCIICYHPDIVDEHDAGT